MVIKRAMLQLSISLIIVTDLYFLLKGVKRKHSTLPSNFSPTGRQKRTLSRRMGLKDHTFQILHQSIHLYASESFRASRSRFRKEDFFGTFLLRFSNKSISWLVGGVYHSYISPSNLKLCPYLVIAVLRNQFPHSKVG